MLATGAGRHVPSQLSANLPFARSGAILARMLRASPWGAHGRAAVIVQWDFAAKHAAVWPATLKSTYWRAWYDVSRYAAALAGRPSRRRRASTPRSFGSTAADSLSCRLTTPSGTGTSSRMPSVPQLPVRRGLGARLPALQVKRLAPTLGFAPDARARDLDARQCAVACTASDGPR